MDTAVIGEEINNISCLPYAPLGKRIIPHDLIRSALFTVVNKTVKRDYFQRAKISTYGIVDITYTGEELRQDDEDVLMQILSLYKGENFCVEFQPYTFLKEMDWPARTQYRDKLIENLNRLSATNLSFYNKKTKTGYSLSLIRKFEWQDLSGEKIKKWKVWLEPEMTRLFENNRFSKIIWEQRKKLNPLAKWLHAFYSSHAEPYPVSVETIRDICGSKTKGLSDFRKKLRLSLTELVQVGFLETFFIDKKDMLAVARIFKNNSLNYYEK